MEEADQKLAETHEENWDEVIPLFLFLVQVIALRTPTLASSAQLCAPAAWPSFPGAPRAMRARAALP